MKQKKTWSRELAVALFMFLGYLAYQGQVEELEVLTWPFVLFSMAAFGFKQPVVEGYVRRDDK